MPCWRKRQTLRAPRRLQEGPRLASFVTWALPRAAGVRELTVRFTNHHQAMKFQVLVGLFGVSLRTLGMQPGCHGAVPLQQPTINLIGYCTGGAAPGAVVVVACEALHSAVTPNAGLWLMNGMQG